MPRFLPLALTCMMFSPAVAEVPRVVADLPFAQSLAAQVMAGIGTPALILETGGDAHSQQLRPSQARVLASADLVLWTGADMTPWMEQALAALSDGRVLTLDAVEGIYLQEFRPSALLAAMDDDHDDHAGHEGHTEEEHADHDHDAHEDEETHAHAHTGNDPHVWLYPDNAAVWLTALAAELAALDPENAATYRSNADRARADLSALQAELAATLATVGDAGLVMFHDAYGYFATAHGLNILGTIARGDAAAPGAARIVALREGLHHAGAVCIFPEANMAEDFVTLLAEGTDLRIGAPLDPAGATLTPGADLYATLLRGLAQSIAECVTRP